MDALRVAGFLVVRVGKRAGRTRASTKSSEWIDGPVIKVFIFMGDQSMQTTFLT